MQKSTFITFDLKPEDIAGLKPFEKQHLLNHTNAWIDKRTKDMESIPKIIITSFLGLIGLIILTYFTCSFFVSGYYSLFYPYLAFILGTTLLTIAFLNSKRLAIFQIHQTKQKLGNIGNTQKSMRFYFLKDLMGQLLIPQTRNLVKLGKSTYVRKQGLHVLLYASLSILSFLTHLAYAENLERFMRLVYPLGYPMERRAESALFALQFILFMPSVIFLVLFIKKLINIFMAIIK